MTYPAPAIVVGVQPLGVPSFGSSVTGTAVAAATDFAEIIGVSNTTTTVLRIIISGVATAATSMVVNLIRRITVNTGGTVTAVIPVARDGSEAARTIINLVTANRTLGTSTAPGGTFASLIVPLGTASAPQAPTVIDLMANGMLPSVLDEPTDMIAINLNGATIAGNVLQITIEHQEQQSA
jgi:hypothetical protein